MARPSMANSTMISRAISTIAWPSWRRRCALFTCSSRPANVVEALARRGRADLDTCLVRVFRTVDRICGDNDAIANCLLYQRSYRLEVEPQRQFDGLISDGGSDGVAARSGRRQRAK